MRNGKRISLHGAQIIVMKNNMDVSRFGFVVSKNVDKRATARNRIKRVLRERVRTLLSNLPTGKDVIIIARTKDEKIYSQNNSFLSALSVA